MLSQVGMVLRASGILSRVGWLSKAYLRFNKISIVLKMTCQKWKSVQMFLIFIILNVPGQLFCLMVIDLCSLESVATRLIKCSILAIVFVMLVKYMLWFVTSNVVLTISRIYYFNFKMHFFCNITCNGVVELITLLSCVYTYLNLMFIINI